MAITRDNFWGDKDSITQEALELSLIAMSKGYGFDKWHDASKFEPTYGLHRTELARGAKMTKVALGTFDSKEELVAMLKLILASEE